MALALFSTATQAVPSFARQTGMACAACHTIFPELTPFGREFKLNGYVIDNLKQIKGVSMERRETMSLNSLPPLSVMLQVSYTHTASALPDSAITGALAKDGEALFPQQVSLFYAGKIAENLGAFMQLTYNGAADHFGFDNTDIRYARYLEFGSGADGDSPTAGATARARGPVRCDAQQQPDGAGPLELNIRMGVPLLSEQRLADAQCIN
jgi:hypothetical protein